MVALQHCWQLLLLHCTVVPLPTHCYHFTLPIYFTCIPTAHTCRCSCPTHTPAPAPYLPAALPFQRLPSTSPFRLFFCTLHLPSYCATHIPHTPTTFMLRHYHTHTACSTCTGPRWIHGKKALQGSKLSRRDNTTARTLPSVRHILSTPVPHISHCTHRTVLACRAFGMCLGTFPQDHSFLPMACSWSCQGHWGFWISLNGSMSAIFLLPATSLSGFRLLHF